MTPKCIAGVKFSVTPKCIASCCVANHLHRIIIISFTGKLQHLLLGKASVYHFHDSVIAVRAHRQRGELPARAPSPGVPIASVATCPPSPSLASPGEELTFVLGKGGRRVGSTVAIALAALALTLALALANNDSRYNNQPYDWVGGMVVGAVATTTTKVGTAPPPTTDYGTTTADDGSVLGGSRDRSEARTMSRRRRPIRGRQGVAIVARRGRSTPSIAATGGGGPPAASRRRCEDPATTMHSSRVMHAISGRGEDASVAVAGEDLGGRGGAAGGVGGGGEGGGKEDGKNDTAATPDNDGDDEDQRL
jgi:hypothetical protein